jgi:hypothetical protein
VVGVHRAQGLGFGSWGSSCSRFGSGIWSIRYDKV